MKMCRWKGLLLSICLLGGLLGGAAAPMTAAAASPFAFSNGKMSKETLRAYCSRAVTLAGFCVENNAPDPIFEEDLRMLRRVGAKYIGRAAYYSWGGNMSYAQVEDHYKVAAERAALAHKADPEMILQAGVFEIIYRGTINNTPVPESVLEIFGQPIEKRNFRYSDMVFTDPKHRFYYGKNYWGNDESAVPDVTKVETQMYFYWQITRYIDAGYEAVHLGQAEMMADNNSRNYTYWDKITTLARAYAEMKARRGVILFDCHSAIDSGGMKIGNRLILDIQGAGIVPNETEYKDGAYQCEIRDYHDCWLQWIGRSDGGEHPLGFNIEHQYTILEFDNYGGNGQPNVATPNAFYNWGYDDVTWFAMQPNWYRNQFLRECHAYVTTHDLDSAGKQQYFLQPSCRRVLTATPTFDYTIQHMENVDFVLGVLETENVEFTADDATLHLTVHKDYRANNPSDGCPMGFGQEDVIREVFLGKNAKEDPSLTGYVISTKTTAAAGGKTTAKKTTAKTDTTAAGSTAGTASHATTAGSTAAGGSTVPSAVDATTAGAAESTSAEERLADSMADSETDSDADIVSDAENSEVTPAGAAPGFLPWIAAAAAAVAAAGCAAWLFLRRKKK